MNALQMVNLVRQQSGAFDPDSVADGFPADDHLSAPGPTILAAINDRASEALDLTGYKKCYVDIGVTADVQEYVSPNQLSDIEAYEVIDLSTGVSRVPNVYTFREMQMQYGPAFRSAKSNVIQYVYQLSGGSFGVWPTPNTTADDELNIGQVVRILGVQTHVDLVLPTDVIAAKVDDSNAVILSDIDGSTETDIPTLLHRVICYGAAIDIAEHIGNTAKAARAEARWNRGIESLAAAAANRYKANLRPARIIRYNSLYPSRMRRI